ncbi:MAG: glycerate kinase, partial [bacterium]|nr:glycerate kinase [bacterium]
EIVAMCDVDNPLTGPHGAAAVYGPQKGADPAMVEALDAGLAHLAEVVRRDLGVDVELLPGAGAAGGMGGGLVAFLGSALERGISVVLEAFRFDELLRGADAVMSGEGSFDSQSLSGKVVQGVAARARSAGVPVHVLAGRVDPGVLGVMGAAGVASARAITPEGMPIDRAMELAAENLARAAEELAERLLAAARPH